MRIQIILVLLFLSLFRVKAQDSLTLKGQFSNWLLYSSENSLSTWLGSRYIPQLNYQTNLKKEQKLDFELSVS